MANLMEDKQILMIPGPTPIPQRVLRALANPAVGHRTPGFSRLLTEVTQKVKEIYRTDNDLLILTSSGTGAMEAAVSNFLNPGDKVIVMENGNFAERWIKICEAYGAIPRVVAGPWGQQAEPAALGQALAADRDKEIKAVYVTHNETSTGVTHDVRALRAVCGDHPAIFVVDSISGMAVSPLETDAWGLDVVVSGSQKAFMLPPGLAFISVSPKAWELNKGCEAPSFYLSLRAAKKNLDDKKMTPYTPAASLLVGLRESLSMMAEEGLANIQARHARNRDITRAAVRAMDLTPLADDAAASAAVTAIRRPGDIDVKKIAGIMADKYNIIIAAGQGKLEKEIFRVGHLGYIAATDILATVACLEMTLLELGWPATLGAGVAAAQRQILRG
ncbi:MAG: alanine--glyoxylate aminotransferase family protein [Peptococcaceae bacterium]|jgi:aspartate aminotransferase-like enzyme|nr:alanine--glyoxylate aminotransferase family protein [Peptococcaceae bacterium]